MEKNQTLLDQAQAIAKDDPYIGVREIAAILGVSRQRLYQVYKAAGLKCPKRALYGRFAPPRRRPDARINCDAPADVSPPVAGAVAECIVLGDLLARGYKPYIPLIRQKSHDIVAVAPSGRVVTIEVRSAIRKKGGGIYVVKKKSDKSQVYAMVDKDLPVQYDPPLPE